MPAATALLTGSPPLTHVAPRPPAAPQIVVWASFSPEPLAESLARAVDGAGAHFKVRTADFAASRAIPHATKPHQILVAALRLADAPALIPAGDWLQEHVKHLSARRKDFARVIAVLCPSPSGESLAGWTDLFAAAGVDVLDGGALAPECDEAADAMGQVPYTAAGFDGLAAAIAERLGISASQSRPASRHSVARGPTLAQLRSDAACPPHLASSAAAPADAWRSVLLTGATGFFGAHLLDTLLTQTGTSVTCLVRAATPDEAAARVRHSLERHGLWRQDHVSRIIGLCGDLTLPDLGVTATAWSDLADSVDAIFHNGAEINFIYPYEALKPANVDATAALLGLACAGRSKSLHLVSTVGLISRHGHDAAPVSEDEDPGDPTTLSNGYEQSKWVADRMVAAAIARGVPASIYRLGLITGHSQSNRFEHDDFLSALIVTAFSMGALPDLNFLLPLIPVDIAAAALITAARNPKALGRCYHLIHPNPLTARYAAALARLRGYDLRLLPWTAWRHAVVQPGRLAGTALETYAKYLRKVDTLAVPVLSIANATAAAGSVLASCPPQRDQLAGMIEGFIAKGRLAAPAPRPTPAALPDGSATPTPRGGMARVVAMDVDRTLIDGQSQTYLVRALFRAGLLPWWMYGRVVWWHVLHLYFNWRPDNPTRLQQIVLRQLTGVPIERLTGVFREVIAAEILPRIRPAALACLRRWQDEGALVFLVSASLEPLIGLLALEIHADGIVATQLRDGGAVASGELNGGMVEGEEKWRKLNAYATAHLGAWRLEAAYGDDDSDVALLSRARRAFAVNPRPGLKAIARERGWSILDWGGPD